MNIAKQVLLILGLTLTAAVCCIGCIFMWEMSGHLMTSNRDAVVFLGFALLLLAIVVPIGLFLVVLKAAYDSIDLRRKKQ